MTELNQLPGEIECFEAVDSGRTKLLQCPAEEVLLLKKGCKVMLIWNKSDHLRNGSPGIYRGMDNGHLVVDFAVAGRIKVKEEVWTTRSRTGEIIASRKQFPLTLMYAITCHKSQGLTLAAAVVHCTKEFVPGLIYVALTRVRKETCLQVKNFQPYHLLKPSKECITVCDNHVEPNVNDFSCCRSRTLDSTIVTESSFYNNIDEEGQSLVTDDVMESTSRIVDSFFERGSVEDQAIDLETIYAVLQDNSHILKTPPDDFDEKKILKELKVNDPVSDNARLKNSTIEHLLNLNDPTKLKVFAIICWSRCCAILIEDSMDENTNVKLQVDC